MKKKLPTLTVVLAAVLTLVLVAGADPEPTAAGPATIVRTVGCITFDGDGNFGVFVPDCRIWYRYTNNDRGNINVFVKGTLPDGFPLPDRTLHFDGPSTGVWCTFETGENWKGILTPAGQFQYTCKVP
jgi:hypothetical protein